MTALKRVIVFDIDGTLADCSHRVHHVNGKRKDWKAFFEGIPDDPPIEQTVWLNRIFRQNTEMPILLCSGRNEDCRADTVEWLRRYGVSYDGLYMRRADDWRADYIIKLESLEQMRADGYEPFLIIDDRQDVVNAWRKAGLFVLQCDPEPSHTDHVGYKFHDSIKWPLTILVGPSGAGKTDFAGDHDALWNCRISSDDIREELCGNFQDQSRNDEVFAAMHDIASARLKAGLPVVLDATHIKTADRIKAAKLVPANIPVRYIVIDRSLEAKRKTAGWRNTVKVKGKPLIEYHDQVFKSNLADIMRGDGLPNVTVQDKRVYD